ncbi:MAG TPA: HEAT repeat domain-containing protein [Longimicrobium sp.]|nr:HEAT repeat domain-containing protein [Longimicrobium sp.]
MNRIERFARRHPLGAAALAGLALLAGPATLLSRSGGRPEPRIEPSFGTVQEGSARELLAAVRGANPVLCELATRSLGNHWGLGSGDAEDVPAGVQASEEARRVLEWVNGKIAPAEVAPLGQALSDPDACVRRTAARLLGRIRTPEAGDVLIAALRDNAPGPREAALLGIAHSEDRRAVGPLVDLLGDGDTEVRSGAAWALGHVGSRDAVQPLLRAIRDEEPRVRRSVARALGRLEDAEAIPALAQLLSADGDPTVRRAAAWALGKIE